MFLKPPPFNTHWRFLYIDYSLATFQVYFWKYFLNVGIYILFHFISHLYSCEIYMWNKMIVLAILSVFQELLLFLNWGIVHLEKDMATHFSILGGRILGTKEPVGCSPWGLQRVGHDWATNTFTFIVDLQCFRCIAEWFSYISVSTYTYMYSFQILFHYRLLQDVDYSFLCYIVGPCCLLRIYCSVYNIY